jgi:hypothetical protein
MMLTGEDEVFENISSVTFPKRNPSWISLGSKLDLRHDMPEKNHVIRLYCESVIGIHWDLAWRLEGIREETTAFNLCISLLRLKERRNVWRYTGGVWRDMTRRHCVTLWINVHSLLHVCTPLATIVNGIMCLAHGVCSYMHDHQNKHFLKKPLPKWLCNANGVCSFWGSKLILND